MATAQTVHQPMTDTAPGRAGEPTGARSTRRRPGLGRSSVEACADLVADTAAVLLVDASGLFVDTYAAVGIQPSMRERVRVRMGVGFVGTIAADRPTRHHRGRRPG